MKLPLDHDVRVWLDASTWLAIKHEADLDDRSMSEWIRHCCIMRLRQLSLSAQAEARGELGAKQDSKGRAS